MSLQPPQLYLYWQLSWKAMNTDPGREPETMLEVVTVAQVVIIVGPGRECSE